VGLPAHAISRSAQPARFRSSRHNPCATGCIRRTNAKGHEAKGDKDQVHHGKFPFLVRQVDWLARQNGPPAGQKNAAEWHKIYAEGDEVSDPVGGSETSAVADGASAVLESRPASATSTGHKTCGHQRIMKPVKNIHGS
jgi:hypothetical protein